jgi:hypothetical protein
MAGRHTYPLVYHLPCWLKVGQRPKDKPLSQYKGFDRIPCCLYEEVISAYPDSPKNIRVDPSSPSPMSKPTMRRLAKRCLATTRDGTQCRWNSESNHPRLLQEDCYTCNQHADCEISQAAIRASESKRKVDFGVKLFQEEKAGSSVLVSCFVMPACMYIYIVILCMRTGE